MHLVAFGLATGHQGRPYRWSFLEIEIFSSSVDNLVLVLPSIAICEDRKSW